MKSLWKKIVYWIKSRTKSPVITMEVEEITNYGFRSFYCVHVFNHGYEIALHDFPRRPTNRHIQSLYMDYMRK